MQRFLLTSLLLLACVGSSGCSVWYNARRTLFKEPRQFSWKQDIVASKKLYMSWADQAWIDGGLASAPCTSCHYISGFGEGFVEYVYGGGTGEPPAAPPRHLWRAGWRTGPGKQAADEWFAGYRHGAAMARDGGYRDQAVLRTSLDTGPYFVPHVDGIEGELIHPEPMDPGEPLSFPPMRSLEPAPLPAPSAAPTEELPPMSVPAAPQRTPEGPKLPSPAAGFTALPSTAPGRVVTTQQGPASVAPTKPVFGARPVEFLSPGQPGVDAGPKQIGTTEVVSKAPVSKAPIPKTAVPKTPVSKAPAAGPMRAAPGADFVDPVNPFAPREPARN